MTGMRIDPNTKAVYASGDKEFVRFAIFYGFTSVLQATHQVLAVILFISVREIAGGIYPYGYPQSVRPIKKEDGSDRRNATENSNNSPGWQLCKESWSYPRSGSLHMGSNTLWILFGMLRKQNISSGRAHLTHVHA